MWAVGVVVREILPHHDREVAWSGDQELVEAFPAQCPDEAFRDRVRPGCPDRGADDADVVAGEHGVERGGELAVPVADQEPEPTGAVSDLTWLKLLILKVVSWVTCGFVGEIGEAGALS